MFSLLNRKDNRIFFQKLMAFKITNLRRMGWQQGFATGVIGLARAPAPLLPIKKKWQIRVQNTIRSVRGKEKRLNKNFGRIIRTKHYRFKNKKPEWRQKRRLWSRVFRNFLFSLRSFNRRILIKNSIVTWCDLVRRRRVKGYFRTKIAIRKFVHKYYCLRKKTLIRIKAKIYSQKMALLSCLRILVWRLDTALIRLGWVRGLVEAQRLIRSGTVFVNNLTIIKYYFPIKVNDFLFLNYQLFKFFSIFFQSRLFIWKKGEKPRLGYRKSYFSGTNIRRGVGRFQKKTWRFMVTCASRIGGGGSVGGYDQYLFFSRRIKKPYRTFLYLRLRFPAIKKKRIMLLFLNRFKKYTYRQFIFFIKKKKLKLLELLFCEFSRSFCCALIFNFQWNFSFLTAFKERRSAGIKFFNFLAYNRYF